jgi:hypothetical protein
MVPVTDSGKDLEGRTQGGREQGREGRKEEKEGKT